MKLPPLPAILIDTREQAPYRFAAIKPDATPASKRDAPPLTPAGFLAVETRIGTLSSGDYSLAGFTGAIAIERKSKADAFGTIGTANRERFERELVRLATYEFAAVVVEAEWSEIVSSPPPHTQVKPKTIMRSVLAWQQRYPQVHWWFVPGREAGEQVTYRILERFWKEQHK